MSTHRAQCLLLIVYETNEKSTRKLRSANTGRLRSSATAAPSFSKCYALFPEVFQQKRPEVLALFEQNYIRVLNNQNVSSLSLVEYDELEIIELLLDESPQASLDPLSALSDNIHREVLSLLFCNARITIWNNRKVTSVRPAVDEKNLQVVKHLLVHKADIFCRHHKENFLHLAARRGPESLIRLVLEDGANINVQRNDQATPLHVAAKNGLVPVVQLLLSSGANIQAQRKDRVTPLHLAAQMGHVEIVRLLITSGATVDGKDTYGQTALFFAARENYPDVIELLLHNGADVNRASNSQVTPILVAATKGHRELVEVLVNYGGQISVRTKNGSSVLLGAYHAQSHDWFKSLLEQYFLSFELLKETSIITVFSRLIHQMNGSRYFSPAYVTSCNYFREILARHIIKIVALDLHHVVDGINPVPLWPDSIPTMPKDFKLECNEEVLRLKSLTVGDTDLTFYDILAEDASRVACYLRNNSVAEAAASEGLQEKFPIFGSILAHHFQQGKEKKQMLEEGIKMFNFLFGFLKKLPHEIKERILKHLTSKDFLILKKAFGRPNVSF